MYWIAIGVILFLNVLLVITMVFLERKSPQSILSWVLILTIFPLVGFLFYAVLGGSLSFKTRKMLKQKRLQSSEFQDIITKQKLLIDTGNISLRDIEQENKQLIRHNLLVDNAVLSQNNKIEIFTRGQDMFKSLVKDIENAKKSINMCYYILATDKTGSLLIKKLIQKASEGVEVNLLIDAVGSLHSKRKQFLNLVRAGGRYAEFFPPAFGFRLFNLKINYRNHRKIVVIDNQIGYTGGMNIRDDHMSLDKHISPWIDMHIKVQGSAVIDLQKTFLRDWRFSYKGTDFNDNYLNRFFEKPEIVGTSGMQIVCSGPDDDEHQIKQGLIKMIMSAKSSIILESPYFVPDDSFLEALKIASNSGVNISIVLPSIPDRKIVYYTTLSYAQEATKFGAKVYLREGFIHSKCLLIDGKTVSIGSCNADNRSFKLNFEINSFIYDEKIGKQVLDICNKDIENSVYVDKIWFKNLSLMKKFQINFFRLFSAIL